ncbi:hypothetical protein OS965_02460 [Streptomyces sp. H27-G5]|uniref:hypothetical protein n=1 Tax=Streptomyces sp. H27-G5 TaxID=2996698 RepID=UPI00226E9EC5|nr:hypothetical protein [Streptomyces sp. H27-G5]MCY0917039.1 hypothetical protein [Streptomyces sp. H27-G5]
MTLIRRWTDITPQEAAAQRLDLARDIHITAPLNENGERCPWPWDPQQLVGAPIGQYHCGYCGAMVMAGMPHIDYAPDERVLTVENLPTLYEWCDSAKLRTASVDGRSQTVGLTIVLMDGTRQPCLFGDTLVCGAYGEFSVRPAAR